MEQQCPKIEAALQHLLATVRPKLVYLYKHRISDQGETVGFKFCVVTQVADPVELERRLYLAVDCPVTFGLLVYTPEEWDVLCRCPGGFAHEILDRGELLFQQEGAGAPL